MNAHTNTSQRGRAATMEDLEPRYETISLDGLVDTDVLCKAFNKTFMTIYTWRTNKGLPFVKIGSGQLPKIKFRPEKVIEWAEEVGVPVDRDILLAAQETAAQDDK